VRSPASPGARGGLQTDEWWFTTRRLTTDT
jgi:hypothetical protein